MISKVSNNINFSGKYKLSPSKNFNLTDLEYSEKAGSPSLAKYNLAQLVSSQLQESIRTTVPQGDKGYSSVYPLETDIFVSDNDVVILTGEDSKAYKAQKGLIEARQHIMNNPIVLKNFKQFADKTANQIMRKAFDNAFISHLDGDDAISLKKIKNKVMLKEKWAEGIKPQEVSSEQDVAFFLATEVLDN